MSLLLAAPPDKHRPELIAYKGMAAIYQIRCLVNNRVYVGMSKDIYLRFKRHKGTLERNSHCNMYLQRAYNKHGADKFIFEILQPVANISNLIPLETAWLRIKDACNLRVGYNIMRDAASPNKGKKITIANLHKLREGLNRYMTPEKRIEINTKRKKPVVGRGIKGVIEFPGVMDAWAAGFKNVTRSLKNNKYTSGGYTWNYKDNVSCQ